MATIGDLRGWDAAALDGAALDLAEQGRRLVAIGDRLSGQIAVPGWTGDAAAAAGARTQSLVLQVNEGVADVAMVQRSVEEAVEELMALQRALGDTEHLASEHGLTVDPDGRVLDPVPTVGDPHVAAAAQQRVAVHAQVEARLQQIAVSATDLDEKLAASLHRVTALSAAGTTPMSSAAAADVGARAGGVTAPPIPPGGNPAAHAAWWAGLSPAQQAAVTRSFPQQVGSLDGLPAPARSQANRGLLAGELARTRTEVARLERLAAGGGRDGARARARLEALRLRQGGLERIDTALRGGYGMPAYLLGFRESDPSMLMESAPGRSIVAFGNPDDARNVLTYVPGTDSSYGSGLPDRAAPMYERANPAGAEPTSVITWMDYGAPRDLVEAALEPAAHSGAPALRDFQEGLRASHDGPPAHQTVLGHSYGSTLVGITASDTQAGGLDADDIIVVGSPGLGDWVTADDLGINPSRVWAGVGGDDWIQDSRVPGTDLNIHGWDPTSSSFGGETFPADPVGGPPVGHSDYWRSDSRAFDAIVDIATGRRPKS